MWEARWGGQCSREASPRCTLKETSTRRLVGSELRPVADRGCGIYGGGAAGGGDNEEEEVR